MNEAASSHVLHGDRVMVRSWQRGDTLAQELWPRYTEPFSSLWNIPLAISYDYLTGRSWSGQRFAWAGEGW